MLGYAASAEASILVWVAGGFTSHHRSILRWLNETGKSEVYAVVVRAYHAGKTLGLAIETVVESDPSTEEKIRPTKRTMSTICAEFYRPVVKRLKQKGMRTREYIHGQVSTDNSSPGSMGHYMVAVLWTGWPKCFCASLGGIPEKGSMHYSKNEQR